MFHAVATDTINLASLTLPCLTRCRESLYKKEKTRDWFVRVHPWSWTIKTKLFLWHSYFKMSFTLFIKSLLTDHHSSRGIIPHIMIFIVSDFLQKIVPTSIIQSAISRGESVKIINPTLNYCILYGRWQMMVDGWWFSVYFEIYFFNKYLNSVHLHKEFMQILLNTIC